MFNKIAVVIALACLAVAHANVLSGGPCMENLPVQPDFQLEKYLGLWYEYAKYPTPYELGGKCNTALYGVLSDGNVSVVNNQINEATGISDGIVGYAVPVSNAKLNVTFPVSPAFNTIANYWVLKTDYKKYSVVYSCKNVSAKVHATTVWILTRLRVPSDRTVSEAKEVLIQNGFYMEPLKQTVQTGCF